jgi:heme/copper-type cytochrome/quinol oxidase subunit 2
MGQSEASHFAPTQCATANQQTKSTPFFAFAAAVLIGGLIILVFVSVSEELRHGEAAQFAPSQRTTADQETQRTPFFALAAAVVISDFVILVFISVSEELRQRQAAQLASPQHSTAYHQAEQLPLVAFVIIRLSVFNVISLPKQVCQQKPA